MILLQILDEGTITDSQGRKVDFKVSCQLDNRREYRADFTGYVEHNNLSDEQPG